MAKERVPRHIGVIPDGNRRWARARGMAPGLGYGAGLEVGFQMLEDCKKTNIEEVSIYGFTHENTHRPTEQKLAFTEACVGFAEEAISRGAAVQVIGNVSSVAFPKELIPFAETRQGEGLRVNLLVNYGWEWDIREAIRNGATAPKGTPLQELLGSRIASRIDLVIRWGGSQRLSGFLPIQTTYADYHFPPDLWPDYATPQFHAALAWYAKQDVTLGG